MLPPLMTMVSSSDVAWTAFCIERDLKPLPEQFALAPGDHAIAMAGESLIDQTVALIEIQTPEEYAERYPDYEERALNSYVLTTYHVPNEPPAVGWYARCRLIPLSAEEYEGLKPVFLDGVMTGTEPPTWLRDRWQAMMDRQAEADPKLVPKHVKCPSCSGRDVQLHLEVTALAAPAAGETEEDGKTVYTPIGALEWDTKYAAHLHCDTCGAQAHLDPNEVDKSVRFPTIM